MKASNNIIAWSMRNFRISFLIGLGVALVALTIAAFIPFRRSAA